MSWVVRSAFGGVVAYFLGGWVLGFLKFTFWPLLFSLTLGWLYEDASGITALDAQRKAINQVEREKVMLVASAFVPKGPYEGHYSKAKVTIRNDGDGEAKGLRIRCKVFEPMGKLVRREGRDMLLDAEVPIASDTNDFILGPHQTATMLLELPLVPTLRQNIGPLQGCNLEIREFQTRPTIQMEEG